MIELYKVVLVPAVLWIILAVVDETLTINIARMLQNNSQKFKDIPGALKPGARKYASAWSE